MEDDDRYTRITLRIPRDMHSQLSLQATATSKSLNAEIVNRLASTFKEGSESADKNALIEALRELLSVEKKHLQQADQYIDGLQEDILQLADLVMYLFSIAPPETRAEVAESKRRAEVMLGRAFRHLIRLGHQYPFDPVSQLKYTGHGHVVKLAAALDEADAVRESELMKERALKLR